MIIRQAISYMVGLGLALLIIAPPIGYGITLWVNSFSWLYAVLVSGFFGVLFAFQKTHLLLKCLSVYLFMACFFSQAPYLSFNAYILIVVALYLFLLAQVCDFGIVIKTLEAAFWLQVIIVGFQIAGMDKLMNFDRPEPVFFGTVMQYMRMSSVFAMLSPFLLLKSKWYMVPLVILCVVSKSSTFALSLIVGTAVYLCLKKRSSWKSIAFVGTLLVAAYAVYDIHSFRGAIIPSNGGRLISWWIILRTWVLDTSQATHPNFFSGPFQMQWFLIGHGLDTFLPLFPIYKHDMNPFPQAHNDWVQIAWETGVVGFGIFAAYCSSLVRRLLKHERFGLVAGCSMMAAVMFFAFPMRMTQTMFLLVVWVGLCEGVIAYEKKTQLG